MTTCGMPFEARFHQRPSFPEILVQCRGVYILGHGGGHPTFPAEDVARAGKSIAGSVGGEEAVEVGFCSVELF